MIILKMNISAVLNSYCTLQSKKFLAEVRNYSGEWMNMQMLTNSE